MFIVRPEADLEINSLDSLVIVLGSELSSEAVEMINSFSDSDKSKLLDGIEQYNDVWKLQVLDKYICNLTEKQLNNMGIEI